LFWEQVVSGLVIGSFYALIALGFVLVFKATEVLNFAQGDLMMLGPFIMVSLMSVPGLSLPVAILISLAVTCFVGFLIERIFIRGMVGQAPFSIVLATLAVSIILRSIAGLVWGHELRAFPQIFSNVPFRFFDIAVSPGQLWIIGISLALVAGFYLFFRFTTLGIAFRATSENQLGSVYCGISVQRVFTGSWVMAAMVGALAGILIAPITLLQVEMGYLALNAFPAAILGGMKSIPGAILGGFVLGLLESLAGAYLADWIKNVFPWLALIIILLIKPEGILGVRKRKKI